jgi:hypothetical protein
MTKLTEEQRARRAATRRREQALAAEADHERLEARHTKWRDSGSYLARDELEAGAACRGCGLPVMERLGDWPWPKDRTPEEQSAYAAAEADFRTRHSDCHSHRWSMSGSRSTHCGRCCPPPPLHQSQIDAISAILRGHKPKFDELDRWRLTLTCEHTVDRTAHRSHARWSSPVVECSQCGKHRGVVDAEKL